MGTVRRGATWSGIVVVTMMLTWSNRVLAHNVRVDLALWGNFGGQTASCQRVISHAAALCSERAIAIRSDCAGAQLGGATCTPDAVEASIQAARDHARLMVQQSCALSDLQNLRYIDLPDALTDVNNLCRDLDTATISAIYGPVMVGGSVGSVDAMTHTCLDTAQAVSMKLLRYAIRARQNALDRIAATNMGPSEKNVLVARAGHRTARARGLLAAQIEAACPESAFESVYGRSVDSFLTNIAQRGDCLAGQVYVQNAVTCPAPVCGNGMQEPGEACDDGNSFEGDGCHSDCTKANCDAFSNTYDLIQHAIFENHGCTSAACHGSAQSGGLDLRAGVSYQNLIDVPSQTVPGFKRVDPGNRANSLLWINLAAGTLPTQYQAPLRSMPLGLPPLSADELEALRIWIVDGGAARTASVKGTANLLRACLPEPKPVHIEPLPPPPPNEGIQMHMPAWTLAPTSESEVCFSSYYDFTGQIPDYLLTAGGTKFRYKKVEIRQDPLSHHLIVDLYRGPESADDPVWGPYSCRDGAHNGETCNPLTLGFCGFGGDCATDPDPQAIACIGFGPQNSLSTLTMGGFAFSQSTATEFVYPPGVYDEIPIKGVVLWNSHAFNLTHQPGSLQGWVNIYFPAPEEIQYRQHQIFDASKIFWNVNIFPLPEVAPFTKMEVCHVHTFRVPGDPVVGMSDPTPDLTPVQAVHLFELSGHTHKHGKRFQIFRGSFTCKGGSKKGEACSPFNAAELCPDGTCTEDTGRDPQASLLYTNFIYNDPVKVRFDPPMVIPGSASRADRSLTFCALYDNGAAPNIQNVKRRSTSPPAGSIFGVKVGGPCTKGKTRCIDGPNHNAICNGNNTICDSSAGAGDGVCDACPLTGGFRTEDEMFILFGNFWVE